MTWHDVGALVSAAVAAIVLVIALFRLPRVQDLVGQKFGEFEEKFLELESTAHAGILKAIGEIKDEQKFHRADANAHPNLFAVSQLVSKMEDVRLALMGLRSILETLRDTWDREQAPRKRGKG